MSCFTNKLFIITVLFGLTGCQRWETKTEIPEPLRGPKVDAVASEMRSSDRSNELTDTIPSTHFVVTPRVPVIKDVAGVDIIEEENFQDGEALQINVENLPIPAFINEVYGELLGLSFEISPELQKKSDLITLRVTDPIAPRDLYRLAKNVLEDYGVSVEKEVDLLRFSRSRGTPVGEAPYLVSGRALPSVPVSHRPIFQVVPLHNVKGNNIRGWLNQIYKGQRLDVSTDIESNSIILQGGGSIVRQALEAISLLDQPSMRGRYSLRIEPVYQSPSELSQSLVTVLQSEGYDASEKPPMGSILVLPMQRINAVLIFTANQELREHAKQWAASLDKPPKSSSKGDFFYYPVENTRADEIVKTLQNIYGMISSETATGGKQPASTNTGELTGTGKTALVSDSERNAIMYYGQADVWARLMPIIKKMDKPPKQVLIEVTIAEVTLSDEEQFGIEWLGTHSAGKYDASFGTLGGLGLASAGIQGDIGGGFSYAMSNAGQTRLVLNALASNQRVNILQSPRIMVKSGTTASIEVGTDVPIVTSQSTATDLATTGTSPSILQNIQYRTTGVIMRVEPVIHAGNRVDLSIEQETSSAEINKTSSVDSPTILTRRVETNLSVKDGGSVLLGGIIQKNGSGGTSGVPILKDIPGLGALFRVDSKSETRTELILLIIPYVIDTEDEAEEITKSFREQISIEGFMP